MKLVKIGSLGNKWEKKAKQWQKISTCLYYIETFDGNLQEFPLLFLAILPSKQIWESSRFPHLPSLPHILKLKKWTWNQSMRIHDLLYVRIVREACQLGSTDGLTRL